MKTLYLVSEGNVLPLVTQNAILEKFGEDGFDLTTPYREMLLAQVLDKVDGLESVLAYTDSADSALTLARRYDAGERHPDNVMLWDGRTVAALTE